MENKISLPARYGYTHCLEHIDGNLWLFKTDPKSSGTYRLIGFEGQAKIGPNVYAFDPEGGPFLSIGSKVGGKTIKSITMNGIFELE